LNEVARGFLASGQDEIEQRFAELARAERLLPVKVSAFYRKKLEVEAAVLGPGAGPLARAVLPTAERLAARVPGEVADFVEDRTNMPAPASSSIIQKYSDRVLFMPTPVCAAHCQYCFRQDILAETHAGEGPAFDADVEALVAHVASRPAVREVILSGGDPMTLPLPSVRAILTRLKSLPQITSIRMHTRTIVFAPQVFRSPEKLKLLADADVRMVFHIVHPYEVCDEVAATIRTLHEAGIRLYNHFPLLRGINDDADLLVRHISALEDLRVRTTSVYVAEPVSHSASFRVSLDRFFAIQDAFAWRSPSWVNGMRFCLDTPIGKVRRENIVGWDRERGVVTFERDGKRVSYPDFPAALDVPGDPTVMLWRG
jgi:lysine 2,3-aminomutase